jgi:hypothetical protein
MIMVDFRIAGVLSITLFSLLFLIPPSLVNRLTWNFLVVATLLVIALLYISNFKTSTRLKFLYSHLWKPDEEEGGEDEDCPACHLKIMEDESFCLHCGEERSKPWGALNVRYLIVRFLVLLMIGSILSVVYVPVFSVTDQGPRISSYSFFGVEHRPIFSPPVGWVLNSSERLVDYETRYEEDYAVLSNYTIPRHPRNELFILMEVSSEAPFLMDDWHLSGWQRIEVDDVLLTENDVGQSVVVNDPVRNETILVLFWRMRLLFRTDVGYSPRTVGISVFMKFNEILSESLMLEIFGEMTGIGLSMANGWPLINRLTVYTLTLSQIYTQFGDLFRDLFFTAVGVVGFFLFASWIRARDKKGRILTELAYLFPNDQAHLLLAASRMEQRKFRGVELCEEYRLLGKEVDLTLFTRWLRKFLTLGLLRKDYVVDKNGELRMVLVRNLP